MQDGYCFTKVDLADAYNQINLAPESQKRLALSTHGGVGTLIDTIAVWNQVGTWILPES